MHNFLEIVQKVLFQILKAKWLGLPVINSPSFCSELPILGVKPYIFALPDDVALALKLRQQ